MSNHGWIESNRRNEFILTFKDTLIRPILECNVHNAPDCQAYSANASDFEVIVMSTMNLQANGYISNYGNCLPKLG